MGAIAFFLFMFAVMATAIVGTVVYKHNKEQKKRDAERAVEQRKQQAVESVSRMFERPVQRQSQPVRQNIRSPPQRATANNSTPSQTRSDDSYLHSTMYVNSVNPQVHNTDDSCHRSSYDYGSSYSSSSSYDSGSSYSDSGSSGSCGD